MWLQLHSGLQTHVLTHSLAHLLLHPLPFLANDFRSQMATRCLLLCFPQEAAETKRVERKSAFGPVLLLILFFFLSVMLFSGFGSFWPLPDFLCFWQAAQLAG